ncbi:hypothetical protein AB0L74_10285 [Streptomyces sp. NPDC052020]|uniref:hypothetical protein n=1 Tax=Streptomyces sp. NPDC052020 TaxID=3155677 RepID=UPI00343A16DA
MADAPTGVRVGSAYIEINPQMDRDELARQLAAFEQAVRSTYKRQSDITQAYARLQVQLEQYVTAQHGEHAAKRLATATETLKARKALSKTEAEMYLKALAEVESAERASEARKAAAKEKAARQRERLALNARNLEVSYGAEVAASYRKDVASMMKDNKNLSVVRINEAKQWAAAEATEAKKVAAEHTRLTQQREAQVKSLSALVVRQAQIEATEAVKAARTAQAAYTAAHNTRKAQILSELAATKAAAVANVQSQIAAAQAAQRAAQQTIKANGEATKALQDNANKASKSWMKAMSSAGSKINGVGASLSEFGRNVQRNVTTPLLTAAGAMSALGISAGDSIIQAQTALKGIGISNKDTSDFIETLKSFGVQTPYTVEAMFKYGAQYTRSNRSHGMSGEKASTRATDLVQAVGDLAAYGGNTDPDLVANTLKAVGNIMESDRASLRNVRTIAESGGLDVQTLAQMLGFKDKKMSKSEIADREKLMEKMGVDWEAGDVSKASAQMMLWMAKAAETGGVPGLAVTDAIIERAQAVGSGKDGSPARKMGAATIKGRLSNMYEATKFGLSDFFISKDEESDLYKYSGAGAALMGKAIPEYEKTKDGKYKLDKAGHRIVKGYKYEGGILEDLASLGGDLKRPAGGMVSGLFDVVGEFTGWLKKTVDYLEDHPGLTDMLVEAGKWGALLGGGAIVLGGLIKAFGLLLKLTSPLAKIAQTAYKGAKGTAKIAGQATGLGTQTDADKEAKSIRERAKREAKQLRKAAKKMSDPREATAARLHAKALEAQAKQRARETRQQGKANTSLGERYEQRRTNLNGGDNRNLASRAWDRVRGRNSQVEEIQVNTEEAQQQIGALERQIEALRDQLQRFKSAEFNELAEHLAGDESSVRSAAEKAASAVREADRATENLKALRLSALADEFARVTGQGGSLADAVNKAQSAVSTLNGKGLGDLDGEVTDAKGKVKSLDSSVQDAAKQAGKLNARSLGSLRGQFTTVKDAADAASKKVGSGESSLISRVGKLNTLKMSSVVSEIGKLQDKLKSTAGEAKTLDSRLDDISSHAPGGGSSKSKSTKKALGGVLPGYTPGRDVHVFTSPTAGTLELSGGESVMRPEWTAAVGPDTVTRWNRIARTQGVGGLRQEMRFARGGIIDKLGLGPLVDVVDSFQVGPDVRGAAQTMEMDGSSVPLGGPAQKGVIGAGTDGSHFIGSDLAKRFRGVYDFISRDSWSMLRKLPIPSGLTQIIGTVGGAVAPVASDYFWSDVWKGNGNILERGDKFLGHMFSTKTLQKIVSGVFEGAFDSAKGLWNAAKSLVTDPVDTVSDAVDGIWETVRSEYDGVVSMTKGLREIWRSPKDYAAQVITDTYATAKESLPNLDGLFDFSGDGLSSKKPDVATLMESQFSEPGLGDAVTRWTPQVRMALAQLGLPMSDVPLVLHRIRVESGGNPRAINLWDSNAKMGDPSRGLLQTIMATFKRYAGPYLGRGIYDPMASIYAGLNYAIHRYGSGWRKALSGIKGYATGTDGAERGWAWVGEEGPELVNFKGGETVLDHEQSMLAGITPLRGYASGTSRTTGIAADAKKGISSLNAAVKKLYDLITKAFTSGKISSGTANSLNKWIDKENTQLQKLVKQREDLAPKLKEANDKLAAIKKDESAMAASIADKAKGLRSLTDIFNSDGVSTSSALNSLKQRLAAIKAFQSDINALTKRGFSKEIIAEISEAGPEQGSAMAKELLNATSAQVKEFNSTYAAIGTASDALGKSVADSYYAAGKKAAQSLVDGLTAKDKKLVQQIEALADTIVKTLQQKLKVSSKTPVDAGLAALLTWLTGEGQAVKGGGNTKKQKTTRVTTSYSTDSKGRKVTTVTTTVTDPAKGTTTTTTERTVGGKTTKSTKVSKIKGYWTGTRAASPGFALVGERGPELVDFRGGERVRDARETADLMGPRYEIHIHEAKSENTTQSVLRAMQYAEVMAGM